MIEPDIKAYREDVGEYYNHHFSEEELETLNEQQKFRKIQEAKKLEAKKAAEIKAQEQADIELKQEDVERQIEQAENSGYFSPEEIEALLKAKNTTPALIQNEIKKREETNTVPTGEDVDEYMKTLGFNSEEIEEIKQSSQQKNENTPTVETKWEVLLPVQHRHPERKEVIIE